MIVLSPRLAVAARFVLPGEPMADIGTDHAYLPAHLVQAGVVPRAIAADVQQGPLEAARSTVQQAGLAGRVDLRLGDGLRVLAPDEVPCVALCGMGGPLMADILSAGPLQGIRRLILQPMAGEEHLRAWLEASGWRLCAEELVEDAGRIYPVLAAEPGHMKLRELERLAGPHLLAQRGPLFGRYMAQILVRARRALAGARRSLRPEAAERALELERRVSMLEEVTEHAEANHRRDRGPH